MKLQVFDDAEQLAHEVANFIIVLLNLKPESTIVLTSGSTPVRAYQLLAQKATKNLFSKAFIIGLDEWVGIGHESEGSCRYIVEQNLLLPLGINSNQYTFFDSLSDDLEYECKRVDQLIFDRGGLDFILVGIGLNGHIGLNEPGSSFEAYCQITQLDEMTVTIGQKYFNSPTPLTKGITVGLRHFIEAKSAMIIASGSNKANIIKETIDSPVSEKIPSSVIQNHSNGYLWVDREAGQLLKY